MIIPGFPDNTVPLAYRLATELEHWFEPAVEGETGLLHPGPSKDVVLVVAAAEGYSLHYDIRSDTTAAVKDEPVFAASTPAPAPAVPIRSNNLMSFTTMSAALLNGTVKRAARTTWKPGRYIALDPAHVPHFATDAGTVWAFRSDDLRARDWVAVTSSNALTP